MALLNFATGLGLAEFLDFITFLSFATCELGKLGLAEFLDFITFYVGTGIPTL